MPTRLGDQCVFEGAAGQCQRTGSGNPPLCRHQYELVKYGKANASYAEAPTDGSAVGDLFAELFRNPAFQAAAAFGLEELLRRAARAQARRQRQRQQQGGAWYAEWPPRPGGAQQPPPGQPPPGQPPPFRRHRGPDPRQVLGIAPHVRITAELVRQRRRELAAQHHPDRGGSTERMQAINRAADALLAQIA